MKKLLKVLLLTTTAILTIGLMGCGPQQTPEPAQTYNVGETVETDIVAFTLDRAELAIAVKNSRGFGASEAPDGPAGGDFFLPKEYDATDDASNPFVAPKGHTLVSVTFTAENLDRASIDLFHHNKTAAITYNGQSFAEDEMELELGAENTNGEGWKSCVGLGNILLSAGKSSSYKAYFDIPVETEDLSSPFEITINLPTSNGETQSFTYSIS